MTETTRKPLTVGEIEDLCNTKARFGGPAFARPDSPDVNDGSPGMSLLDWFAGQSVVSSSVLLLTDRSPTPDELAARAYAVATALLRERERRLAPAVPPAQAGN